MKVGGYRVDPQEIEDVIMDSGLVVEAAVVGMPDDLQSTVIEALIVPVIVTDGQEELFVHCARCLPRYKVPQHFFVIAELPKKRQWKNRPSSMRRDDFTPAGPAKNRRRIAIHTCMTKSGNSFLSIFCSAMAPDFFDSTPFLESGIVDSTGLLEIIRVFWKQHST